MLQRRTGRVFASSFKRRLLWTATPAPLSSGTTVRCTQPHTPLLRRRRELILESWRCFTTDYNSAAAVASSSSALDNNEHNIKNIEHESIVGGAFTGTVPYNQNPNDDATATTASTTATVKEGNSTTGKKKGGRNNLLEYTQSLLSSPSSSTPDYGNLSYTKIMEISHCIQQWISTGEHRHLGADQALLLLQRLIFERMVVMGRKRRKTVQVDNGIITWEMFHIPLIVSYLNELYTGQDLVDKMMSIVAMFEEGEELLFHEEEKDGQVLVAEEGSGWEESVPYKSIIAILCDARTVDATAAAELILYRFESRWFSDNNYKHANPPTTETYNRIISSWYNLSRGGDGGPGAAENGLGCIVIRRPIPSWPYNYHPNPCSNLLSHMVQLYNSDRNAMNRMKPDEISFNIAISSLSRDQQVEYPPGVKNVDKSSTAGKECYDHLMTMLDFYNADLVTFSTVLHALSRGNDEGDEERAKEVLDVMLYMSGIGATPPPSREVEYDVLPRTMHFNVLLGKMARRRRGQGRGRVVGGDDALDVARRYVGIMEMLQQNEERDMTTTSKHEQCNSSEYLFAEYGNEGFDNVEGNNEDGTSSYEEGWDTYDKNTRISMTTSAPNIVTYNCLLSIAARLERPEAVEEILDRMIERYSSGKSQVKPNRISFNTVLLAWSKVKSQRGRLKTEEILHRMNEMADNGDELLGPDRMSMTTVINAITSSYDREAPIQAERIIELMEGKKEPSLRPDVVTYTSLIKCWAKSGRPRAGDRAVEIINKLHQRYDDGYTECKPDTMLYNVALNAIAEGDGDKAPERAEELLNRMLDRYYAGDTDLAPTTHSFSMAILAWARSNDERGAMKAEQLLQKMHAFVNSGGIASPNTICYSTCILAWKNSHHPDAGIRAQSLLEKMETYENSGLPDLKPNVIAYTTAMDAWINSRHPDALDKVEAILERMIDRSRNGDPDSEPTTTTMNIVMKAIRYSSIAAKYQKAEELLKRMKWMDKKGIGRVRPTVSSYNAFFSACAMTGGSAQDRMNAFSSVLKFLGELQGSDHMSVDSYTWPAVWKACENLLDVEKDMAWINHVFELTIRSGHVNELLFNNMRRLLPAQYLQKKLKTGLDVHQMTVHQLPSDWTCNAKLGRDRNRQYKTQSKHRKVRAR